MNKLNEEEIKTILYDHEMWLKDRTKGKQADFSFKDLSNMDFNHANLGKAKFTNSILVNTQFVEANLNEVEFINADLRRANFSKANLNEAEFSKADIRKTNFSFSMLMYAHFWLANFSESNLSEADMRYADLSSATLKNSNFKGTDLHQANLTSANLINANFYNADLSNAILQGANLSHANLHHANVRETDFRDADLNGAILAGLEMDKTTIGITMECPEEGSFVCYKKIKDKIIVLKVPEDAKRSSSTNKRCRCSKAEVIRIEELDGSISSVKQVNIDFNEFSKYEIGNTVEISYFDENRWNEYSTGIQFFMNKEMAKQY